jgi:RNA polymerase-binding transcription factor DksA
MAKKVQKGKPAAKKAVKAPAKPIKKAAAKPVAKKAVKTAPKKVVKTAAKKVAKPIAKKVTKVVAKKAIKPVAKKVTKAASAKPVTKAAKKPIAKKVVKSAPKKVAKPIAKKATKVVAKKAIKPVAKKAVKSPAKPIKKAAAKPIAKKVVKTVAKKVVKPIAKPVAKSISKPVAKPIVKKAVVEVVTKPVIRATDKKKFDVVAANKIPMEKNYPPTKKELRTIEKSTFESDRYIKPDVNKPAIIGKTKFNDNELNEFKVLINNKISEAMKDYELLKDTLSHRGNNGTDDTSPTFKLLEDGSEVLSKEETTQLAIRQEKFIQNLKNALIRIENKTYGVCRATGNMISKERLRSVPHATLSIEAKRDQA